MPGARAATKIAVPERSGGVGGGGPSANFQLDTALAVGAAFFAGAVVVGAAAAAGAAGATGFWARASSPLDTLSSRRSVLMTPSRDAIWHRSVAIIACSAVGARGGGGC